MYSDGVNMEVALETLMCYRQGMLIRVDRNAIDCNVLEEYLNAEPYSDKQKVLAKLLVVAAKNAFLVDEEIPKSRRLHAAERGAKEMHQVLEALKTDIDLQRGKITQEEHNIRRQGNIIVSRCDSIEKVKKTFNRLKESAERVVEKGIVGLCKEAVTRVKEALEQDESGKIIIKTINTVANLIPQPVKEDLKDVGYKLIEKAKEKANEVVTKIGTGAKRIAKKIWKFIVA